MIVWVNFSFVIAGQFLAFCLVAKYLRLDIADSVRPVLISMVIGLPIGLIFDVFIGHYQLIFSYREMPYQHFFWLLNGFFSYGLAIATIWLIPVSLSQHQSTEIRTGGIILICFLLVMTYHLALAKLSSLAGMFAWGIFLILYSEGLAAVAWRIGPLLALAKGQFRPLLVLWAASLFIGALYETLNGIFPLWRWHLEASNKFWCTEALIISMGYFVLLLPMLILSRLIINDKLVNNSIADLID